ncbi:MAG: phosphopyruvate hydratase [Chloroflexi bacterium]|jgi:enolase|nr:phosphopyruvate hydratase [Chloroflexota bacterium]MBT5319398.1 phosphopyruvate hydratase [Chloroflexota bacterium]MBT6682858.1 phosphopyruvate hydratase [Chloroflexota bacterium]
METITDVHAREILDSRGNPTVYVDVRLSDGTVAGAMVPSGASTGQKEALELRDGDPDRYMKKGVLKAVANANGPLKDAVIGRPIADQQGIDRAMLDADGTDNKSTYGANALLGVSLAAIAASAKSANVPLYRRIAELSGTEDATELPTPMFNLLNGGAHATGSTDFQEFMVMPAGFDSYPEALRAAVEIYHTLRIRLEKEDYQTAVGDEGGFAPAGFDTRQALTYLVEAIEGAGYRAGIDVFLALDPASSEFGPKPETGKPYRYNLKREGRVLSTDEMVDEYESLVNAFPIASIEDGLAEDDWAGWIELNARIGDRIQLVGDDLLVTQQRYVDQAIQSHAANAVLVKVNQVGTVTETLQTIATARAAGWGIVISHRSGETEDTTIADLVVGTRAGQLKAGAPARSDRVAKYNRLLAIADELGGVAEYAGRRSFR